MNKKKTGKVQHTADTAIDAVNAYRGTGEETDVLGSYTGIFRAADRDVAPVIYPPCGETLSGKPLRGEDPVQDADDL